MKAATAQAAPTVSTEPWALALRVVQRNAMVYKRTWKSSIFFTLLNPLTFMAAMGLGLGALLRGRGTEAFGGVDYLSWVAPGVLAASVMQTASFECSFPTITKISFRRNYEAMLATPLSVIGLLTGELIWAAVRLAMVAAIFFVVIALFGIPTSPASVLAVPAAVLTGLAFGSVIIGYSASRKSYNDLSTMFRFVVTPLFLFSGTFFPVDRMPSVLRPVAYVSPLYHGAEVIRGAVLGTISFAQAVPSLLVLFAVFAFGFWYANRSLKKRLES